MLFKDRKDAGIKLAEKLLNYKDKKNTLLIALPRGGVVVAKEIGKILNLEVDVVTPKKIGAPFNLELAIGAVLEGEVILKRDLIREMEIDEKYVKKELEVKRRESTAKSHLYRGGRSPLNVKGKSVILVDDGIATGATVEVAIKHLKKQNPEKIVVATPVVPKHIEDLLTPLCDEFVYLYAPMEFFAIGQFYENFEQVEDKEVIDILKGF
jgi:putative phosphoribosyl transferase